MNKSDVYVGDQKVDNPCLRFLLRSWTPKPTVASTLWTYGTFSILLIIFSIVLFTYNSSLPSYTIKNYDEIQSCRQQGSICEVNFSLQSSLPGPVYLQYGLTNFQQNNKKYMNSKSGNQLYGKIIDMSEAQKMCNTVVKNIDLHTKYSWNGTLLDPEAVANPCGYIANSFFNDTYSLFNQDDGSSIFINENGIAWKNDNGRKFRRAVNSSNIQWIDPTNEHFMVWMRTSSQTSFHKPWGIIDEGLPAGRYTLRIVNNYNSEQYNSHKNIKFSTVGGMGARNYTLPIVMLVFGVVFCAGCIIFAVKQKITNGKFGPKFLE